MNPIFLLMIISAESLIYKSENKNKTFSYNELSYIKELTDFSV